MFQRLLKWINKQSKGETIKCDICALKAVHFTTITINFAEEVKTALQYESNYCEHCLIDIRIKMGDLECIPNLVK